jgi:hypothetical protein
VRSVVHAAALVVCLVASRPGFAATTCAFDSDDTTLHLTGDCVTDATLLIPNGMTLDGGHFTIAAVDPPGEHFIGAVIMNAGATASIVDTRITAQNLADVCDSGPGRLRGIFFDGAAGLIRGNTIIDVNQGASRCAEGNAIEVRTLASIDPVVVEIDHNVVSRYQKSGIVVTGGVDAWIHDNQIGASATQDHVPANALQVGYGAWAMVAQNRIAGNSWRGFPSTRDAATAILVFRAAPETTIRANVIDGNADIGIYIGADGVIVEDNQLTDEGPDIGGYDTGIADYGVGSRISGNVINGYQLPIDRPARTRARQVALRTAAEIR